MKGYKYGYKLRPPSIGTQPKGFLSLNAERYRGYWGYVIYDRKLTEKEMDEYELEYLEGENNNENKM